MVKRRKRCEFVMTRADDIARIIAECRCVYFSAGRRGRPYLSGGALQGSELHFVARGNFNRIENA